MRSLFICIVLFTLQAAFSQEVVRKDVDVASNAWLLPESPSGFSKPDVNGLNTTNFDTLRILSETRQSLFESNALNAFDVRVPLFSSQQLSPKSSLSTYRSFSEYIGLGSNIRVGSMYNYQLLPNLTASAGVTVSRFQLYNELNTTVGLNAAVRWKIADRLYANANGTYLLNPFMLSRPEMAAFYPQNAFGGNLEFKVSDSWGLQMGAERQFDVFKRKWITVPYVMPVFYK